MRDYSDLQDVIETLHGKHLALLTSVEEPQDLVRHQAKVELCSLLLQALDGIRG